MKKGRREKKRKKEEKPRRKVRIFMIFDFEYRIMCILDFGREFLWVQNLGFS